MAAFLSLAASSNVSGIIPDQYQSILPNLDLAGAQALITRHPNAIIEIDIGSGRMRTEIYIPGVALPVSTRKITTNLAENMGLGNPTIAEDKIQKLENELRLVAPFLHEFGDVRITYTSALRRSKHQKIIQRLEAITEHKIRRLSSTREAKYDALSIGLEFPQELIDAETRYKGWSAFLKIGNGSDQFGFFHKGKIRKLGSRPRGVFPVMQEIGDNFGSAREIFTASLPKFRHPIRTLYVAGSNSRKIIDLINATSKIVPISPLPTGSIVLTIQEAKQELTRIAGLRKKRIQAHVGNKRVEKIVTTAYMLLGALDHFRAERIVLCQQATGRQAIAGDKNFHPVISVPKVKRRPSSRAQPRQAHRA